MTWVGGGSSLRPTTMNHVTHILGSLLLAGLLACGDEANEGGLAPAQVGGPGGLVGAAGSDDPDGAGPPGQRASAVEGAWVATLNPHQLVRFAPGESEPSDIIRLPDYPQYLEIVDGVAFYTNDIIVVSLDESEGYDNPVYYYDLRSGKNGEIRLAEQTKPGSMTFADGSLWIADQATDALWRINPATKEVVGGVALELRNGVINDLLQLSATEDQIYVASFFGYEEVARIDMATDDVITLGGEGDGVTGIAAEADAVWITSRFDGMLRRLDPQTLEVEQAIDLQADISRQTRNVATTDSDVWVVSGSGGNAQAICCEPAKPGLFRVDKASHSIVSYLPLEQPGGLRRHGDGLWALTASAVLQIDTSSHEVARTLRPPSGTVVNVAFPVTGGGTGSTAGRDAIDVYSVVEPPPMLCEGLSGFPSYGEEPLYGTGTAEIQIEGDMVTLGAGTCQTLRDAEGNVVQYLATFANGLPDGEESLRLVIDGYTGEGGYSATMNWELDGHGKAFGSVSVTLADGGRSGVFEHERGTASFDCGADSALDTDVLPPAPAAPGEALVEDTERGIVYRFINVACEREVLGGYFSVKAPGAFSSDEFYSLHVKSNDPAEAGTTDRAALKFLYYGAGQRQQVGIRLTLECDDSVTGSFESDDGHYRGSFHCGT